MLNLHHSRNSLTVNRWTLQRNTPMTGHGEDATRTKTKQMSWSRNKKWTECSCCSGRRHIYIQFLSDRWLIWLNRFFIHFPGQRNMPQNMSMINIHIVHISEISLTLCSIPLNYPHKGPHFCDTNLVYLNYAMTCSVLTEKGHVTVRQITDWVFCNFLPGHP